MAIKAIDSNLPPEDNLRKEDKSSAPKVSFIRRLHCSIFIFLSKHVKLVCINTEV